MQAKLKVVSGKASKAEVELKLPTIIGRSRQAGLTVAHQLVSRQHCELFERDGFLYVRDNGSLNGTLIGGQKIAEALLQPGDHFTVGPLTFEAIYDVPAMPAEESPEAGAMFEPGASDDSPAVESAAPPGLDFSALDEIVPPQIEETLQFPSFEEPAAEAAEEMPAESAESELPADEPLAEEVVEPEPWPVDTAPQDDRSANAKTVSPLDFSSLTAEVAEVESAQASPTGKADFSWLAASDASPASSSAESSGGDSPDKPWSFDVSNQAQSAAIESIAGPGESLEAAPGGAWAEIGDVVESVAEEEAPPLNLDATAERAQDVETDQSPETAPPDEDQAAAWMEEQLDMLSEQAAVEAVSAGELMEDSPALLTAVEDEPELSAADPEANGHFDEPAISPPIAAQSFDDLTPSLPSAMKEADADGIEMPDEPQQEVATTAEAWAAVDVEPSAEPHAPAIEATEVEFAASIEAVEVSDPMPMAPAPPEAEMWSEPVTEAPEPPAIAAVAAAEVESWTVPAATVAEPPSEPAWAESSELAPLSFDEPPALPESLQLAPLEAEAEPVAEAIQEPVDSAVSAPQSEWPNPPLDEVSPPAPEQIAAPAVERPIETGDVFGLGIFDDAEPDPNVAPAEPAVAELPLAEAPVVVAPESVIPPAIVEQTTWEPPAPEPILVAIAPPEPAPWAPPAPVWEPEQPLAASASLIEPATISGATLAADGPANIVVFGRPAPVTAEPFFVPIVLARPAEFPAPGMSAGFVAPLSAAMAAAPVAAAEIDSWLHAPESAEQSQPAAEPSGDAATTFWHSAAETSVEAPVEEVLSIDDDMMEIVEEAVLPVGEELPADAAWSAPPVAEAEPAAATAAEEYVEQTAPSEWAASEAVPAELAEPAPPVAESAEIEVLDSVDELFDSDEPYPWETAAAAAAPAGESLEASDLPPATTEGISTDDDATTEWHGGPLPSGDAVHAEVADAAVPLAPPAPLAGAPPLPAPASAKKSRWWWPFGKKQAAAEAPAPTPPPASLPPAPVAAAYDEGPPAAELAAATDDDSLSIDDEEFAEAMAPDYAPIDPQAAEEPPPFAEPEAESLDLDADTLSESEDDHAVEQPWDMEPAAAAEIEPAYAEADPPETMQFDPSLAEQSAAASDEFAAEESHEQPLDLTESAEGQPVEDLVDEWLDLGTAEPAEASPASADDDDLNDFLKKIS